MDAIYFDKNNLEGKALGSFKAQIDSLTLYVEGSTVCFYHAQDCCEDVFIFNLEEFCKELEPIIGSKISSFSCEREIKDYRKKT